MPFIEFILYIVVFIIFLGIGLFIAASFATLWVGILLFTLCLGWFPILMCASDPEMFIRWVDASGFWGFFERWAFIAMLEYSAASALILALALVRPDPDGLPPAWKFLAYFYVPRAVKVAQAATGKGTTFKSAEFVEAVNDVPASVIGKRIDACAFEKATEHVEAEAERIEHATKLAEASIERENLKARQEAVEEFKNRHDK